MLLYYGMGGFLIMFLEMAILFILAILSAKILYQAASEGSKLIKPLIISLFATPINFFAAISIIQVPNRLNAFVSFFALFLIVSIIGIFISKRRKEHKLLLLLGHSICWTTIFTMTFYSLAIYSLAIYINK